MSNSSGSRTDYIQGSGNVLIDAPIQPSSNPTATAAQSFTFQGTGTLTLANTNGGTFNGIAAAANVLTIGKDAAPTAGSIGNSILKISGNYTIGGAGASSLVIIGGVGSGTGAHANRGTLSLVDGTVNTLTINSTTAGATVLTMAGTLANTASSILNMEVGAASDSIVLGSGLKASIGTGGVIVNITGIGNLNGTNQNLISTSGTGSITGFAGITLGTLSGNFGGSVVGLTSTGTALTLTEVANATLAVAYWKGAVDGTWNGFSGANANNSNWTTDSAGTIDPHQKPGATTDVFFAGTGAANFTTSLGIDQSVQSLTFSSTGSAVTINGATNTLTIGAGGITVNSGAAAPIINSKVAIGVAQTWTNNSTNSLSVNGAISDSGNGLTKAGTGALVLGGNNTFTGGLTINDGAVQLTNAGALNSTTPNSVTFGASAPATAKLQLNSQSVTISALSTNATPGTPIVENANAAPATLTVSGSSSTTFAGVMQNGTGGGGALSLNKSGAGVLTLAGVNTYTGTTTVANGALLINGSLAAGSAVNVTAAANSTTAALGGTGTINGTVLISSPTGTLRVNEITAGGVGSTGTLTLANGLTIANGGIGYFDINDGGSYDALHISSGSLTLSSGAIIRVSSGLTSATTYNLITYSGANPSLGSISFQDFSGNPLSSSYGFTAAGGVLSLTITPLSAGAPSISIASPTSGIRVMKSTSVPVSGNIGNTGTATLNGTLGDNAGNLAVSGFTPGTAMLAIGASTGYTAAIGDTGTTLGSRSFSVKLNDPAASPNTATASGFLFVLDNRVVSASAIASFGSVHAGATLSASTSLTSLGTDDQYTRVTVANAAADSNGITVSGGNPSNVFNGSTSDTRTVGGTVTNLGNLSGPIVLATTGEAGVTSQAPVNVSIPYSVHVYSGKAAWSVNTDTAWTPASNWSDTQAGDIGGAGTPGVDGILSVGDTATFGDVAGAGGTITVSLNGTSPNLAGMTFNSTSTAYTLATGTSGAIILTNAAAPINVINTNTISAVMQGTLMGINKTNTGTLILSGANTYTGGTTISGGTIQIIGANNRIPVISLRTLGDGLTGSGKLILGDGTTARNQTLAGVATAGTGTANAIVGGGSTNSTLTISNASGTPTFAGTIGGAGTNENNIALVKDGAGTQVLTGNNTYTGGTTFKNGTLSLGSLGAINLTGTLDLNFTGGTLQYTAANTTDYSARFVALPNGKSYKIDTNGQNITFATAFSSGTGYNNGGLNKIGAGKLTLGVPSSYYGPTTVTGGVLVTQDTLPISASISLAGGVWEPLLTSTLSIGGTLGTIGSTMSVTSWTAGGFAAKGAPIIIKLDDSVTPLAWSSSPLNNPHFPATPE